MPRSFPVHDNSDNITTLASALTVPEWMKNLPGEGTPIDVAGRLVRSVITLDNAAEAVIVEAGSNPDLSESGQAKAKAAAGETLLEELDTLREESERIVTRNVQKARAARPQLTAEEKVASSLRATEIRNALSGLADDQLKLGVVIREAVERGDSETIDALLTAPAALPLASAFNRADLMARRAEMVDASLGEGVVNLVQAERDLNDRLEWTASHIRQASGLDAGDDGLSALANADLSATG